jgi:regulator of replication initiation timing
MAQTEIAELLNRVRNLEEQLQNLMRENETLRRENQTLKERLASAEYAVQLAGAASADSAATNKAAADQNFPWYVPYLEMSCREQAAHVSYCYLH